jgi:hypothetical protein
VPKESGVVLKESELRNGAFQKCNGYRIYNGKVSAHVFRNSLRPIADLTISPYSFGARESISVATPFDLLRKKKEQ